MPKEPFRSIALDWERDLDIETSTGGDGYIRGLFLRSWVSKGHKDPDKVEDITVFLKPHELDDLIVTLIEAKMKIEYPPREE